MSGFKMPDGFKMPNFNISMPSGGQWKTHLIYAAAIVIGCAVVYFTWPTEVDKSEKELRLEQELVDLRAKYDGIVKEAERKTKELDRYKGLEDEQQDIIDGQQALIDKLKGDIDEEPEEYNAVRDAVLGADFSEQREYLARTLAEVARRDSIARAAGEAR